jgi:hypothetical protein
MHVRKWQRLTRQSSDEGGIEALTDEVLSDRYRVQVRVRPGLLMRESNEHDAEATIVKGARVRVGVLMSMGVRGSRRGE